MCVCWAGALRGTEASGCRAPRCKPDTLMLRGKPKARVTAESIRSRALKNNARGIMVGVCDARRVFCKGPVLGAGSKVGTNHSSCLQQGGGGWEQGPCEGR